MKRIPEIFQNIFHKVMTELYSEPSQTSKKELFRKTVADRRKLSIFQKKYIKRI